jgi:hypothetical protein
MRPEEMLKILKTKGSQKVRQSMERFGITADRAVGITTKYRRTKI